MKRTITTVLLAALLPIGASAAVLTTSSEASAEYVYYRSPHPPDPAWVARYHPYYYNGYAHYYYGGYWHYYRPGYGWYYYPHPPGDLCHHVGAFGAKVVCR